MTTIGSYEAKTHLPELLDRVANGEQITITKHGVPVAMLVPVTPAKRRPVREVIEEMLEARRGRTLGGLKIKDLIEEGRR